MLDPGPYIQLIAALVVATPGYLAWRQARINTRQAAIADAAAQADRDAKARAADALVKATQAQKEEAKRVNDLVTQTLRELGIKIDAQNGHDVPKASTGNEGDVPTVNAAQDAYELTAPRRVRPKP